MAPNFWELSNEGLCVNEEKVDSKYKIRQINERRIIKHKSVKKIEVFQIEKTQKEKKKRRGETDYMLRTRKKILTLEK